MATPTCPTPRFPLWATLSGPSKLALLGHELGHEAAKDARRSWWVSSAIRTLREWQYLLTPTRGRIHRHGVRGGGLNPASGLAGSAEILVFLAMAPVSVLLGGSAVALNDLSRRSGQRAEHLADQLGAQLGGTRGAVELQERLLSAQMLTFAP